MIVRSLKYQNEEVLLDGQFYSFKDYLLELPESLALRLTQMSPEYEIVRTGKADQDLLAFNPATWTNDYKKIIWDGPIGYNNGYGKASMMFIEGLDKVSDVHVINSRWIGSVTDHMGDNLTRILEKPNDKIDAYYVKFFPAFEFTRKYAERFIGYTMLEASRIPESWVNVINDNCERVVVPCIHQKEAFINSGVKRDVEVVPLGIIPEMFPLLEREEDELYYFATMGTLTYRKGTDLLVKAFTQGLPKDKYPNARLYIKTLPVGGVGSMWFMTKKEFEDDGRIEICYDSFSPSELITDFFQKVDCFVFPTRGEGWGLPVMEAMATGLPVICTNYSGTSDFMTEKTAYRLDYKLVDVPNGTAGGYPKDLQAEGQQWADPDLDQLIEYMRYCYDNRDKAKAVGRRASTHVKQNFNAEKCATKLVKYLDKKF